MTQVGYRFQRRCFVVPVAMCMGMLASSAFADLAIGVTPGSNATSIEAAAEVAAREGLNVEVVEFSDWTTPNLALAAGDLDANYFQHQAFLDNANASQGTDLVPAGWGVLGNIGLYSTRYDSFHALPQGASVALANDPVNQGRGLALLQSAGLVKLPEGIGANATLDDIRANPKDLQFVEVEGPQLVRAIDDVDLALGYPNHFVNAGKTELAGKALIYSGIEDERFALRIVSRSDNAADPELLRFIEIFQTSPEVSRVIADGYAGNDKLYSLAWLTKENAQ